MQIDRETVIELAKLAGMEVHERKQQVRIGSAVMLGCDSTETVERFAQLVAQRAAEQERDVFRKLVLLVAGKHDAIENPLIQEIMEWLAIRERSRPHPATHNPNSPE